MFPGNTPDSRFRGGGGRGILEEEGREILLSPAPSEFPAGVHATVGPGLGAIYGEGGVLLHCQWGGWTPLAVH